MRYIKLVSPSSVLKQKVGRNPKLHPEGKAIWGHSSYLPFNVVPQIQPQLFSFGTVILQSKIICFFADSEALAHLKHEYQLINIATISDAKLNSKLYVLYFMIKSDSNKLKIPNMGYQTIWGPHTIIYILT